MANTIRVSVLGDVRDINNKLGTVNNQLSGFGKSIGKVGTLAKGLFAGIAVGQAVSAFKSAVDAGSDLNETISKTTEIFGTATPQIRKFGEDAATSLGLSEQAALDGVSTFGNFFNQIGVGVKRSADLSKSFVRMSSDLASFNNAAPEEVMDALASATRGEYDALQRYIPTINAASVQQEALAATGKKTADQLTDQDKAIALHTLAVKGMGKAQGDFARTSDGLANQQRILKAQFTNLKATIGSALLPVVLKVVTFLNNNMVPAFEATKNALEPVAAAVKGFFNSGSEGQSKFAPVVEFVKTQVIPAFIGIGQALADAWAVIQPIIMQVYTAIASQWSSIAPEVNGIWTSVKEIIIGVLELIKVRIQLATRIIQAIWSRFGGIITSYMANTFKNVITIIGGALKVISGIIKVVTSVMKGDWKGAWDGIKKILSGAMGIIKGLVSQGMNTLKSMVSAAWTAVRALTSAAWEGIKSVIKAQVNAALGIVRGIPGAVKSALGNLGSLLLNAGSELIGGFIEGIESKFDSVKSTLGNLTSKLTSWKGPPKRDKSLLTPAGRLIMKGLVKGLRDGRAGVKNVLGDVTDFIEKFYDKRIKDDKKAAKRSKAAIKSLANETKALIKNGKKREAVYKKLEKAQKRLADLQKSFKDYKDAVVDNVLGYTDVSNLGSAFNSGAMLAELQKRLNKVKEFAALIKKLKQQGLNATMLDQLIQAGVEGGLGYATAIAQGGPEAIAEFNNLQNQINQAASGLGTTGANSMYGSAIEMTEGLIKGLNKQRKKLEKVFRQLARDLMKAFNDELNIKVGKAGEAGKPNKKATASPTAARTAGNTYQITVNAPVGSSSADIGRELTKHIKEYERIGGRK